jgi:transposase
MKALSAMVKPMPSAARPCLQTADVSGQNSYFGAMKRGDLTDQQWQRLEPLLPPEKPWTGRPNEDHRQILNGILWIHRTGAPWRDLPRRYGPTGTVSSRFYRWRKAGIWQRILSDLQAEAHQRGEIDWDLHFVDATIVRAHQHAAGARRDGATPEEAQAREALGRSQGGFSTKLHLRAEGHGRPITVVLTGGERNEQIALEAVLDQGAVGHSGRGRPRLRPRAAACDKGYSSPTARARLRRRHIRPVIPTRKDQPRQRNFDREGYRLRNQVERLINRLKQARRIATRYEKRGENYLAIVHIGMILLWMKPFADTA